MSVIELSGAFINRSTLFSIKYVRYLASEATVSRMFFKIVVLINFLNSTEKHMLESLFNKVAGLKPATLLRDCNTVNLRDF